MTGMCIRVALGGDCGLVWVSFTTANTPNLDPPPFDTGRPLSSNRLSSALSSRCTGFKKRDTTEAALLARAASGLSLVADERGGLISSRTARPRGVRVNLVLAMVLLPQTRPAESSAIPSDTGTGSRSRSHAAQARFFLAARRSEHGLVLSTRRLTSAMNSMCSALVTSAARCPRMALPIAPYADRGFRTRGKAAKS